MTALNKEGTAPTTAQINGLLDAYLKKVWPTEPADLTNLRVFTRPPMGNMPCVLYASFNLFWLGESMQLWRTAAQKGTLPLGDLTKVIALDIERHAGRLEKWQMQETVALMRALEEYFRRQGPRNNEECVTVLTAALIVLDRMQNWLDAAIPWAKMDKALKLL